MKEKVLRLLVSMKFLSWTVSTVLFAKGILSENGWIMVILTVVGMKEAHKMANAYRYVAVAKNKGVKK